MTDTTIRSRNMHKISTWILAGIIVLTFLGGIASHFLKPTGVIAFAPVSFGTASMEAALPLQATAPLPDRPRQLKAVAVAGPLPAEKPPVPEKVQP